MLLGFYLVGSLIFEENVKLTHRLPVGHEAVAHPPARGAVPADVGEASLVVSVGRAEGDLLDGLQRVHSQV